MACRRVGAKKELMRLVRVADGGVEVDTGGRKPGRGAYLCRVPECWEIVLKGNRLEQVLRTILTPEYRERLVEYRQSFLQGVN